VIYNKELILGLHLHSWHRAPRTLGITCQENWKAVFCYVNEMTFGKPEGWGLVAGGANHVIRGSAL